MIASSIFQDLPEAPKAAVEEMEVDPTPAAEPAAETKEGEEAKETGDKDKKAKNTAAAPPKYTAPIDPTTSDLLPECTVYLRLLMILANLDAGRVQQVRLGHKEWDDIRANDRLASLRMKRWRLFRRQTGGQWIRLQRRFTSTSLEHTSCKDDLPNSNRTFQPLHCPNTKS